MGDTVSTSSNQKPICPINELLNSKMTNSNKTVSEFINVNQNDLPTFTVNNVFSNCMSLPLVHIKFKHCIFIMLLDSGSSVSLLDKQAFENVRSSQKIRLLSRSVRINTVNSELKFTACAEISFKLDKQFFRHSFFISNLESHFFHGILGADFLKQHNVLINFGQNKAIFDNFHIELIQSVNSQCRSNVNNISNDRNAYLSKRLIIQSGETVIANLNIMDSKNEKAKEIYFIPNDENLMIDVQPSITQVVNNSFKITIRNLTDSTIHLNKNKIMGIVTDQFEIKSNDDSSEVCNNEQYNLNNDDNFDLCNLIVASDDMLRKRKEDLKPEDFQLDHLNENEKQTLINILMTNFAAFSKSIHTLGCSDRVTPSLTLKNPNAIKTLPFDIPFSLREDIKRELDEMVEAGLIQRNVSKWASPLVLVKKKQPPEQLGEKPKYRLAMDLRLLNSVIENSTYPLPKISTLINDVSKYKLYCVCDMKHAYAQLILPEQLQDILTFTTPFGSFSNRRLVFGLKTAASTFQALVDLLIEELNADGITGIHAYQDDFLLGADSFDEMIQKISALLKILIKYNLTLSPSKCIFIKDSIDYLGFHISHNTISPVTSNIAKITQFAPPKTAKQVKKFLGVCGFYRTLIPNFADLISVLTPISNKQSKFKWTQVEQEAFDNLQQIFFSNPFVRLPDFEKSFFLNTDASTSAISAVLLQEHQGTLHPVSFFSKSLSKSEAKYPAIKLELMAIYKGVMAFKTYLYNRKFTVISDSKPLRHYRKITSPADIVTRWLLALSEYTFDFKYIPGPENVLADYFSRAVDPDLAQPAINSDDTDLILPFCDINHQCSVLSSTDQPCNETYVNSDVTKCKINDNVQIDNNIEFCHNNNLEHNDPCLEISTDTFKLEQSKDTNIIEIVQFLSNPTLVNVNKAKNFLISQNKLLMYATDHEPHKHKIVVPESLKAKVLSICHVSHTGIQKTYELVNNRYFWKGMYSDTVNFVLSCPQCIKHKAYTIKPAPLQCMWLPTRPGQFVSMDIVGPIKDCGYALTFIDHFSRHMVLYSLNNLTTETVSKHLINYISHYGRMSYLLTDLGTQFRAEVFDLINKKLGIKLVHSSVAHAQSNGKSERVNTSLKTAVLALHERGISFQNSLIIHQSLYNGTVHSVTNFTPNMLHYGRNISLIFDCLEPNIEPLHLDKAHYLQNLLKELDLAYSMAYSNSERGQVKQNSRQKPKSKLRSLRLGDMVYVKSRNSFKPKFDGPFSVIDKINNVDYVIQLLDNPVAPKMTIHINRLRLCPQRKQCLITNNNNQNVPTSTYNLRSKN